MEKVMEFVKEHPLAISAGAVVLLLVIMRGGGGSTDPNTAAVLQAQKTASATDISLASINAQTSLGRTAAMADLWKESISSNAAVVASQNHDNVSILATILGYKATAAQTAAQQKIAEDQIASSQVIAAQGFNTQITMNRDNLNTGLVALAQKIELQHYGIETQAANLPLLVEYQKSKDSVTSNTTLGMGQLNLQGALAQGQVMQAIAAIQGATAQRVAELNTAAARTNADTNQTTSWLGAAASIFSLFL